MRVKVNGVPASLVATSSGSLNLVVSTKTNILKVSFFFSFFIPFHLLAALVCFASTALGVACWVS